MEFVNSPTSNISNEKENLIFQSSPDGQQNIDINQFFVEKKCQSSDNRIVFTDITICIACGIPLCFFILSSIPFIVLFIPEPGLSLYSRILIILLEIIIILIFFIILTNKIVLLKDQSNKKIYIKEINFLCSVKKKISLDLENTHFYIEHERNINSNGYSNRLFIINDYKNLIGIDLDKSNIKQEPAKYLYSFDNIRLGKYNYSEITDVLNDFVGCPRDYKNPLFFNVYELLKKESKKYQKFSSYMKLNDNFFSYQIIDEFCPFCTNQCFMKFIIYIDLLIIIGAVILFINGIVIMIRLIG